MNKKLFPLRIKLALVLVSIIFVTHVLNVMLSWNGLEFLDLWRIVGKIEIDGNNYIHNVSADSEIVKDEETGYYVPLRQSLLELKKAVPEIGDIYVADRDGYIKRDIMKNDAPVNKNWKELLAGNNKIREVFYNGKNAVSVVKIAGNFYYILSTEDFFNEKKIHHPDNFLIIKIDNNYFKKEIWRYRADGLLSAVLTAGVAGGALFILLTFIPLFRDDKIIKSNIYAAVFVVFVIAQCVNYFHITKEYENTYVSFTRELIVDVNKKLHDTLAFLMENNVRVNEKKMMLDDLVNLSKRIEQIESINFFTPGGKVLFSSASMRRNKPVFEPDSIWQNNIPLHEQNKLGEKRTAWFINVTINKVFIKNAIKQYSYNCLTIAVISIVIQSELIFLILMFFIKKFKDEEDESDAEKSFFYCQQVRFLTFMFIFSMDIPATFVSLYMGSIYKPMFGFSREFLMAFPLSLQIAVSAVCTYIAGTTINRIIWKKILILGIFLLGAGSFFSSLAELPLYYILARVVAGAGFGCSITAIVSYLNWNTTKENRAQGYTYYLAGVYAGSISGATIGALFADRFDYNFGFILAGISFFVLMILFLLFKSRFDSPFLTRRDSESAQKDRFTFADIINFVRQKRIFATLMVIVSTFIVLLGFIYYYLPIFLKNSGFTQSDIGRVNLLYGLCIIYSSRYIGMLIDRSGSAKYCSVVGGLLGVIGLILYSVLGIVPGIIASVFLLALCSIFVNNSGYAYYVESSECKAFGEEKALGIFNMMINAGQMLGPVVFAGFIVHMGNSKGTALIGIIYLIIMVLFSLLAANDKKTK